MKPSSEALTWADLAEAARLEQQAKAAATWSAQQREAHRRADAARAERAAAERRRRRELRAELRREIEEPLVPTHTRGQSHD